MFARTAEPRSTPAGGQPCRAKHSICDEILITKRTSPRSYAACLVFFGGSIIVRPTPVEAFDAQVLLDPLEEQLYLPPATVKLGDGGGRK